LTERHRFIDRALRMRHTPGAGYGVAILTVLAATGLRWVVGGQLMAGVPFITFYPAIILSALLGGYRAGALATVLSAMLAWYLFLPPAFSFAVDEPELVALLLFLFISAINVGLVWLLNRGVDRIVDQERNVRVLIESAPNGVVVVDEAGIIKLVNASAEKLFGYSRSELLGQRVDMLVPAAAAKTHREQREAYQRIPKPAQWAPAATSADVARTAPNSPWRSASIR
jgi:K+-sensing histidine kinase KdpD